MDAIMSEYAVPQEFIELSEVDGISISDGLRYCGSIKDFQRFLEAFYLDIDGRAAELDASYRRVEISYFTIKVHALKSTARVIGAVQLSEMALTLELAGKAGDISLIDEKIEDCLILLKSYKGRLNKYMLEVQKQREDKKVISEDELGEAFAALREIVPTLDVDAVEMILEELDHYQLPEEAQQEVDEINRLLRQFDWDHLEELLGVRAVV